VSARALLTVVVGAVPLIGPPLVAVLLTVLEDALSTHTDRWLAVLGGLYIVVSLVSTQRVRRALRLRMGRS
jgi:branched-chain amino acid transport system permease protein